MPTNKEYNTVMGEFFKFKRLGFFVDFKFINVSEPSVTIGNGIKKWKFCDPDWHVVHRQLETLYKTITGG